jgi:hypothetical protein
MGFSTNHLTLLTSSHRLSESARGRRSVVGGESLLACSPRRTGQAARLAVLRHKLVVLDKRGDEDDGRHVLECEGQ